MSKCNIEIRQAAKDSGVFLWELANAIGVSEPTITRKMRTELPADEKGKFLEAITQIAAQKNNASC